VSLWEAVLRPELLKLPEELARVDVLLDDPVFFGPFEPFFDPRIGRPSTPMETYLCRVSHWVVLAHIPERRDKPAWRRRWKSSTSKG
jgi:hypothetical protein